MGSKKTRFQQKEQEFQLREQEYLRREHDLQYKKFESQNALAFASQE